MGAVADSLIEAGVSERFAEAFASAALRKARQWRARLVEKFDVAENGCWVWNAGFTGQGYGSVALPDGGWTVAHKAVFEEMRRPVPPGLFLDHLCRNRACVNPCHLEVVTHRENTLRGEGVAAKFAARTHCNYGHEYSDENTRLRGRARICVTCERERRSRSRKEIA